MVSAAVAWVLVVAAIVTSTLVASTRFPARIAGHAKLGDGQRLFLSPKVTDGYQLVRDDEVGFALAVPDDYFKFELTKYNVDSMERQLKDDPDPDAAQFLQQIKDLVADGGVLLFYDDDNYDQILLRKVPSAGEIPSDFLQTTLDDVRSEGGKVISKKRTSLAGRDSAQLTYQLPDEDGDEGEETFETMVVVEGARGEGWVLTLDYSTANDPHRDQVVASLRVH